MSKQKYSILIVAHPDDETIFFSGLLMRDRTHPWIVLCVTDGNADEMGSHRKQQLQEACKKLKIKKCIQWDFVDRFDERLPISKLQEKLSEFANQHAIHSIYTHGILGEYGHPHHQDVSLAVHEVFYGKVPVWSHSYNSYPKKKFSLSKNQFSTKTDIITSIYKTETLRFMNFLPLNFSDGIVRTSLAEVRNIYNYFIGKNSLDRNELYIYKHLYVYLKEKKEILNSRPF